MLTIFIRSCFRVAELRGGFGGALANDEGMLIGLEGVMVVIAAVALSITHPCLVFRWDWQLKRLEAIVSEAGYPSSSEEKPQTTVAV